jgi:quercetin dioxygenase-like cupin family protein
LLLVVSVLAVVGLVGTGHLPIVVAQSGTPMAEGMPPGVTAQPLGGGHVDTLPAAPADLVLIRFTLAPGASMPIDPNDPSLALAYIESGTLTVQFASPLTVTRASAMNAMATPGASGMPATEQIPAGTTGTLQAGDSVIGPPNVGGTLSNAGTAPVVVLTAIISPSTMGTPAAPPAA